MIATRSKGAITLGVVLAALLFLDLYRAEFGTPQHQPIPLTTVGVSPAAPVSPAFTGQTPGQPPGQNGTNGPASVTPPVP